MCSSFQEKRDSKVDRIFCFFHRTLSTSANPWRLRFALLLELTPISLGVQFLGGLAWSVYQAWFGTVVGASYPRKDLVCCLLPQRQGQPCRVNPETRALRGVGKPAVPAPTQREAGAGPRSLACWKCDIDASFWLGLPSHKSNFAAGTGQR